LSGHFGGHIFGCDICQDVCPWNNLARKNQTLPRATESGLVDLRKFILSDENDIHRASQSLTSASAMTRAKPSHLKENAKAAMKNLGFL